MSENIEDRRIAPAEPDQGKVAPLLSLIRQVEASSRYDAFYAFDLPEGKPIDEMTVNEVLAYQQGYRKAGGRSTAAGAYQIIWKTLSALVGQMKLDGLEVFDAALQDRMAVWLLRGRGLDRWLHGGDWMQFAHALSKEWASLPNVLGIHYQGSADPAASYWSGVAGNKALVSIPEMRSVLEA